MAASDEPGRLDPETVEVGRRRVGELLAAYGVSHTARRSSALRREIADLEARIERARAELAALEGRPADTDPPDR